ncbi:MAG: hypothetical protein NTY70_13440 [Burkholderiales bacterium]|nr:hypothetical protein [Burkholderiales bacterium]
MNTNNSDEVKADVATNSDDGVAGKSAKRAVRGPRNLRRAPNREDASESVAAAASPLDMASIPAPEKKARQPRQARPKSIAPDAPELGAVSSDAVVSEVRARVPRARPEFAGADAAAPSEFQRGERGRANETRNRPVYGEKNGSFFGQ